VDEAYLENCGATVYFIKTPQNTIPSTFPCNNGKYFELYLDKPEGLACEW